MKTEYTSSRDNYIVEFCRNKKILHIGPCDWPYLDEKIKAGTLLYARIDEVCSNQIGVDLIADDVDTLNHMSFKNSKAIVQDMNNSWEPPYTPDVIIFGETIEHLVNVGQSIQSLKKCMGPNTVLLISTPNAYAFGNFVNSVQGVERQHPDHSVLFSEQVLTQLCHKLDLEVQKKFFTFLDSTKSMDLNWKGKLVDNISRLVGKIRPRLASTLLFVVRVSHENNTH